jgi:MFS family permease
MNTNATTPVFDWLDGLKFNRFHGRLVILASLVCIFAGYNSQIIAYIVPSALKEWQLTPVQAGTMISYGFLGLMVGAAGFGLVSSQFVWKAPTRTGDYFFGKTWDRGVHLPLNTGGLFSIKARTASMTSSLGRAAAFFCAT